MCLDDYKDELETLRSISRDDVVREIEGAWLYLACDAELRNLA